MVTVQVPRTLKLTMNRPGGGSIQRCPGSQPCEISLCAASALTEDSSVKVRFLLGPAGSGKTFRCLTELRNVLCASPDGPPLLLVAPRQTTYQLERQLLEDNSPV